MEVAMINLAAIFIGGGLGATARYMLSYGVSQLTFFSKVPLGTLVVNALGSLLIGFFFQMFQSLMVPAYIRVGVAVGFIGAFTTFSTYVLEIVQLITRRQYMSALLTFVLQNLFGFAMVITGVLLAEVLLNYAKGGL